MCTRLILHHGLMVFKPDYMHIFTLDYRLKKTRQPVRSAIHKLAIQLLFTLNHANRNSLESRPVAASRVSRMCMVRQRNVFVSISCQSPVNLVIESGHFRWNMQWCIFASGHPHNY